MLFSEEYIVKKRKENADDLETERKPSKIIELKCLKDEWKTNYKTRNKTKRNKIIPLKEKKMAVRERIRVGEVK